MNRIGLSIAKTYGLNNLANAYMLQGRHREAGTLYLEVVEASRRMLGDDHIRTAAMKANLGGAYHMQGRHEEAERFYRGAIDTFRQVGNVNISAALYSLARLYLEQGRHDEARRLYDEAIAVLTRTVGPEHPQTISYIEALADINQRQRRYDEAGRLHGMVLDASRRAFGETDPRTLASLKSLVQVHLVSGHQAQAGSHLRVLLAARKRAAEGDDADASARNAYARELLTCEPADMRDPRTALEVAQDAAAATGHKDPDILDTLALAYHMTSRHEEAVQTERHALALLPEGASPTRDKLVKSLAAYEAALRRP